MGICPRSRLRHPMNRVLPARFFQNHPDRLRSAGGGGSSFEDRSTPNGDHNVTKTKSAATGPNEALVAAVAAHPDASAAELAAAADVGRSTPTKALSALAADGRVVRVAGGRDSRRRLSDRWSLPHPVSQPGAKRRTANKEPERSGGSGGSARLPKGKLAGLVLAYLRGHDGDHSPSAVAKALGDKSAGAVANALGRCAERGEAVETSVAPRRYRAAGR